jgi:hypothetical protein
VEEGGVMDDGLRLLLDQITWGLAGGFIVYILIILALLFGDID